MASAPDPLKLHVATYNKQKLSNVDEDECAVHFTLAQMTTTYSCCNERR